MHETTAALRSWLRTSVPSLTCRIQNPDIARAGRYGAAHGGTAGPGGDGQHNTPGPRRKQPLLPARRWRNDFLGVSLEERTKETLCKPTGGQNPRLMTGLSAVCQGGEKRSSFLDAAECTVAYLSL